MQQETKSIKSRECSMYDLAQVALAAEKSTLFYRACERANYMPQGANERQFYDEGQSILEKRKLGEPMVYEEIVASKKKKGPTRVLPKEMSDLVFGLLGGSDKMSFGGIRSISRLHYAIAGMGDALHDAYPYLNTSEVLVLCDKVPSLREEQAVEGKGLYDIFHEANSRGFADLGRHKSHLADETAELINRVDPYHTHQNLKERVESMPSYVQDGLLKAIVSPSENTRVKTKVPKYKKKGCGSEYAHQDAVEIASVIKGFSREIHPEFQ